MSPATAWKPAHLTLTVSPGMLLVRACDGEEEEAAAAAEEEEGCGERGQGRELKLELEYWELVLGDAPNRFSLVFRPANFDSVLSLPSDVLSPPPRAALASRCGGSSGVSRLVSDSAVVAAGSDGVGGGRRAVRGDGWVERGQDCAVLPPVVAWSFLPVTDSWDREEELQRERDRGKEEELERGRERERREEALQRDVQVYQSMTLHTRYELTLLGKLARWLGLMICACGC
jgi:hypothetical protein